MALDWQMYSQYGRDQQAQNQGMLDTLQNIWAMNQKREMLNEARLDQQRADAVKMEQDPAYILSQVSQGKEVSPYQKSILDIAAANAQKVIIDPTTGQLMQTGGFPQYGQQPQQPSQFTQQANQMPSMELDEEQQAMLASATNPKERAEVRKQIMQEGFEKRKESRKVAEQQKKDLMQSRELKRTLDTLLKDPDLAEISGPVQGGYSSSENVPAFMKTKAQRKLQPIVNKLKGQQFLQAYQGLRGGGQITEVEGRKAEQAQAALDQSMEDADYRKALEDYRKVIENGIARAEGKEPPHTFEEESALEIPQGYVKIGTSGGKDVYRSPEGRTFVME